MNLLLKELRFDLSRTIAITKDFLKGKFGTQADAITLLMWDSQN